LPPEISIDTPAQDGFVCDDFKLESRISASDDYGLKTIRIHRALNDVYSAPKVISFDKITHNDAEAITFDVKSLGVQPGDSIAMYAEAIDNCPDPHLARSRTLHLMVISTQEYNDSLRRQTDISDIEGKYTQLINEFHDLVDQQKEISNKVEDLKKVATDPAAAKEVNEQLDRLLAKQAELDQKLDGLGNQMEHFVREKPLYDLETDLQRVLKERAQQIHESVARNRDALEKNLQNRAAKQSEKGKQGEQGKTGAESAMESLASLGEESKRQVDKLEPEQKKAEEETMPPLKDAALMNQLVRDFNAFKYLYDIQSNTAGEAKAYESRNGASEDDRLALRHMANTEREMQKALAKTAENLRKHAQEAREKFPKAAKSAEDLAKKMEGQQLGSIAGQAANRMSQGAGPDSYALAERLRQEMEQLFGQCEGGSGQCKGEMDQYLKLQHKLNAGNTFEQMKQGRKFGFGFGAGSGQGEGEGGEMDGYSMDSGNFQLFGNETLGGDSKKAGQGGNARDQSTAGGSKLDVEKSDAVSGMKSINRQSSDVNQETPMSEYQDVIDAYFNSITK
jgi:hypothetical protein